MSSDTVSVPEDTSVSEAVRVDHGRGLRSPSLAVVEAIASLTGVDAEALGEEADIVLYDHVNPDAIDRLVTHRSGDGVDLAFTVDRYEIRVDGDEAVARLAE
ncbi:hypothetical protein DQW50_01585 [Halorubrum sp. 48-1-W]|uniref:HalOD1 output domain-containing protein n=1 Tax=Halorubrum sp. 48-1-W TaxID=2249761 RepID=UPI000DCE9BAD|nr:HalOD1 output domain-containing protein [Halorubrum sp. 48-1-W]RAW47094.1 hypothetical protein DQW50_01585 [Halorubrum sp. 48-1-W]